MFSLLILKHLTNIKNIKNYSDQSKRINYDFKKPEMPIKGIPLIFKAKEKQKIVLMDKANLCLLRSKLPVWGVAGTWFCRVSCREAGKCTGTTHSPLSSVCSQEGAQWKILSCS